ncbi:hypothetical protein PR048_019057 [Dryococelus australis]|uniref:Uncharacterized protein n=1 Tax=Dryococelus australis TaxID=614101 RepID=A0ABQ9H2G6_9NEOP|nr:hypothetical protein PR048_019057 [Dryococelus australis]
MLRCRKTVSNMFLNREDEGVLSILIKNHLIDDEERFKAYFIFTREQFASLLNYEEEDLRTEAYNPVESPITSARKLVVTLRYFW